MPDDGLVQCESCGKHLSYDEMEIMGDCWMCSGCVDEWQAEFDACEHDWWEPYNFDGDEGKICRKCNGFMRVPEKP